MTFSLLSRPRTTGSITTLPLQPPHRCRRRRSRQRNRLPPRRPVLLMPLVVGRPRSCPKLSSPLQIESNLPPLQFAVREARVVSGLPAASSTERPEILDDEGHVMSFSVVGGDNCLRNYKSVTTVHGDGNGGTWWLSRMWWRCHTNSVSYSSFMFKWVQSWNFQALILVCIFSPIFFESSSCRCQLYFFPHLSSDCALMQFDCRWRLLLWWGAWMADDACSLGVYGFLIGEMAYIDACFIPQSGCFHCSLLHMLVLFFYLGLCFCLVSCCFVALHMFLFGCALNLVIVTL